MTGETRRRPSRAAFIAAALLAGAGALLLREGFVIPDKAGYSGIGSGGMLKLIGGCLIGLGAWTVLAGIRGDFPERPPHRAAPLLWITGGLGLQLVLLKPLGFILASALLFACTATAFGERRFWISLPAGIILALLAYVLFDGLLGLNLPSGPLETLISGG